MSLLALLADNFELEPPPSSQEEHSHPIQEEVDSSLECDLASLNDTGLSQPLLLDGEMTKSANDAGRGRESRSSNDVKLLLSFLLMVVIGTLNKIFQKLQAIPMYNYPNSLNLLQNFIYVPLCFLYILPVSYYGLFHNAIPPQISTMNKRPFILLGFLDCITCLLLTFAAVYLPGSLLILLPQAAIPISMMLSNAIKGETYRLYQYCGAVVVLMGIGVVLEPLMTKRHEAEYVCQAVEEEFCSVCSGEVEEEGCLSHRTKGDLLEFVLGQMNHVQDTTSDMNSDNGSICQWIPTSEASRSTTESTSTLLLWSIITILACIPMTLSSIYKEMMLSPSNTTTATSADIDPIFLNGWVAFYQFLFSFPLAFPAGMTSNPPVSPSELPSNIYDGIRCYLGRGTISDGCHPDDQCHLAPLYVNLFLVFNVAFNILIVYILKFGSANVLFMAGTVMVPIGNLAFALPFMPGSMPLQDSDVAGLFVILLGLITYRFGDSFRNGCWNNAWWTRTIPPFPWRRGKNRYRKHPSVVLNEKTFEWDVGTSYSCLEGEESKVPSAEVMKSLLSGSVE